MGVGAKTLEAEKLYIKNFRKGGRGQKVVENEWHWGQEVVLAKGVPPCRFKASRIE